MIDIQDARKSYRDFSLHIDSLHIGAGRIAGLVGTNGSGKTTTFKLIAGLIQADSGNVDVLGMNAWKLPVSLKEQSAFVFADSTPDDIFTAADAGRMLAAFYPDFDSKQYQALCEQFDLPQDKPIGKFSTGMKAKLNVIGAVARNPKLLVLDEPTSGMDVIVRGEIHQLLQTFMEQPDRAILISSHIAGDVEQLCDEFYMIHDGSLILHEETDRLLDCYGVLVLSDEQMEHLDGSAVIARLKVPGGWRVLVSDRQFYEENEPDLSVEKGNLDDLIVILEKGERA